MNICSKCKFGPSGIEMLCGAMPICKHDLAPTDPVYGGKSTSCATMRAVNCLLDPKCGPEGAWFEEAPPQPEPVKYELPEPEPEAPRKSRDFWRFFFGY